MNRKRKTTTLVVIIVTIVLSTSVLYIFYRQPEVSVSDGMSTINYEVVRNITTTHPVFVTNTSVSKITQNEAPVSTFQLTLNDSIAASSGLAGDPTVGALLFMNLSFAGSILDNMHPSSVTLHIVSLSTDNSNKSSFQGDLMPPQQINMNTTTITVNSPLFSFVGNTSASSTLKLTNAPILLQFEHSKSIYYNFSYSGLFNLYYHGGIPSTLYINATATLNGLPSPVSATVNTELTNVF